MTSYFTDVDNEIENEVDLNVKNEVNIKNDDEDEEEEKNIDEDEEEEEEIDDVDDVDVDDIDDIDDDIDEDEDDDNDDENGSDYDSDEDMVGGTKKIKKQTQRKTGGAASNIISLDENLVTDYIDTNVEEVVYSEDYLQKVSKHNKENYIADNHPECMLLNSHEIDVLTRIVRDKNGIIIDDLHKTNPFLSKYEKARILGQRAIQLNTGALAFVRVPEKIIEGYLIAELELAQKKIPFIIQRPIPNGGNEYWKLADLEIL